MNWKDPIDRKFLIIMFLVAPALLIGSLFAWGAFHNALHDWFGP